MGAGMDLIVILHTERKTSGSLTKACAGLMPRLGTAPMAPCAGTGMTRALSSGRASCCE